MNQIYNKKELILDIIRRIHKDGPDELLFNMAQEAGLSLSIRDHFDLIKMNTASDISIAKQLKQEHQELRKVVLKSIREHKSIRPEIKERYVELNEIFGQGKVSEQGEISEEEELHLLKDQFAIMFKNHLEKKTEFDHELSYKIQKLENKLNNKEQ